MEFVDKGNGRVWPPIVPDCSVHGYIAEAPGLLFELMNVSEFGLICEGACLLWSEIEGVSLSDNGCVIHSGKYTSGGLRFQSDGVFIRPNADASIPVNMIDGYPVFYCLLNRISYENRQMNQAE